MQTRSIIINTTIILWIIILWILFYQNIAYAQTTNNSPIPENHKTKYLSISNAIFANCEEFLKSQISTKENNFDLHTDNSIQRYISDDHKLEDRNYKPTDLVPLDTTYIITKDLDAQIRYNANNALVALSKEFMEHFDWDKIYLFSSFRSAWHQSYLLQQWCTLTLCAAAWASEHQLWLAVDIHVYTKNKAVKNMWWEYYQRLLENAHLFWYTNTYKKGYKVDWKIAEPWHRRYVGVEMATDLYNMGQTMAEYFEDNQYKNVQCA